MINLTNSSGQSTASFGSPFPGQGVPYGAGTGRTGNFGYGALGGAQAGTGKFGSHNAVLSPQMSAPSVPDLTGPSQSMAATPLGDFSGSSGGGQMQQHFNTGAQGASGESSNPASEMAE